MSKGEARKIQGPENSGRRVCWGLTDREKSPLELATQRSLLGLDKSKFSRVAGAS